MPCYTTIPTAKHGMKRAFDLVLVLLALPFAALLVLIFGVVVRLTSPGPAIFRQARVGRGERPFICLKLRTMRTDTRNAPSHEVGASGVTPIGNFLRRTKVDELPQLWNILLGDMSFVGPRPIRPIFFAELATDLPGYWQRLVVRPGLTGFAQVRRGYETSMAEKLAHDLEWIADRSARLYLRTVFATGWRVLKQSIRGLVLRG